MTKYVYRAYYIMKICITYRYDMIYEYYNVELGIKFTNIYTFY